jgi:hypothetical protein
MSEKVGFEYIKQQYPFSHSAKPVEQHSFRDAFRDTLRLARSLRSLRRLGRTAQPFVAAAIKEQEAVEQRRKTGDIVEAASTVVRIGPDLETSLREHGPRTLAEAHLQDMRDRAELDFLGDPQTDEVDPVDPQALRDFMNQMRKPDHIDPTEQ